MKPTRDELREAASEQASPERLAELAARDKALARAVASNTATPGDLLDRLAEHQDRAVRRRVVRNPATPARTVVKAGSEFPADLLDNPAFDLYLIEEPHLLDRFGQATLRALLKRETCPASFFAYAARRGDADTQLAVLMNPLATGEAIEECRKSNWKDRDHGSVWRQRKGIIEACDLHLSSGTEVDWKARFEAEIKQAHFGEAPKPEQFALAEVSLIVDGRTAAEMVLTS